MKIRCRVCVSSLFLASFAALVVARMGVAEDKAATVIPLANGTLMMSVPASWESVPPKMGMIDYEFKAPKDKKEGTARVTIMQATGGIDANIDRWVGQFDGLKKSDAKIEKKEVAGAIVHFVDIAGTYKESMGGGPFAPGKVEKRENYRMLGVIVETKDAGTTFLKMTGPQATVEPLAESFKSSVFELKRK